MPLTALTVWRLWINSDQAVKILKDLNIPLSGTRRRLFTVALAASVRIVAGA
jgi:hypothetical protein